MNYENIKKEIKEISVIAASVPDGFRDKCFEMLLNHLLSGEVNKTPDKIKEDKDKDKDKDKVKDEKSLGETISIEFPSHIKAFMRRRDVSKNDIDSLVMLDDDTLHFIKEPSHAEASRGQNEWALLLALKNGILENSLKADPEDVRSLVQDKGFYDAKNFSSNFKKKKYKAYFKEALEPQGPSQALGQEGEKALADLIKTLVG